MTFLAATRPTTHFEQTSVCLFLPLPQSPSKPIVNARLPQSCQLVLAALGEGSGPTGCLELRRDALVPSRWRALPTIGCRG